MKAIIQDRCGSPDALEVLVRVRAASVHADVWHAMTGQEHEREALIVEPG